jgi:DNA-binding MarR family transcriptional regulator
MADEVAGSHESVLCLRLMQAFRRVSRGMRRWQEDAAPPVTAPLSPRHVAALEQLLDGPATVSELAARLGLTLPTVSGVLADLDRAGFIERHPDPADRRRTIVAVIPDRAALIVEWLDGAARPLARVLDQLSPCEQETFLKAMNLLESELHSQLLRGPYRRWHHPQRRPPAARIEPQGAAGEQRSLHVPSAWLPAAVTNLGRRSDCPRGLRGRGPGPPLRQRAADLDASSAANVSRLGAGTAAAESAGHHGYGRGGYTMMPHSGQSGSDTGTTNTTAATTENWSGYAATGAAGTFTSVSSSWTQPSVTCGSASTFSSFWVGLDGAGSPTVEQTGTEADCSGGQASYSGWFEAFPAAPVTYQEPVQPGDAMSASVTSQGGGSFSLTLADATQGWTKTTDVSVPSAQLESAEVIAEAPSSQTVLPLADFGAVQFSDATVNGQPIGDDNPVALTMASAANVTEATPSALDGGNSFSVTWDSSGTSTAGAGGGTGTGTGGTPGHHHHHHG